MKSARKSVDKTTKMRYVTCIAKELGVHRTTVHGWFAGKSPSPLAKRLLEEKFPELYEEITKCRRNTR